MGQYVHSWLAIEAIQWAGDGSHLPTQDAILSAAGTAHLMLEPRESLGLEEKRAFQKWSLGYLQEELMPC